MFKDKPQKQSFYHYKIYIADKVQFNYEELTVKHDFSCALFSDGDVWRAVCHGPLLGGVALVEGWGVNLENVGRPEDQVEALEARQTAGVVHQDHVVTDSGILIFIYNHLIIKKEKDRYKKNYDRILGKINVI